MELEKNTQHVSCK